MSDSDQPFSWYDPQSVRQTVQNGKENNIETNRIAMYLAERDFDEVPLSRVKKIVDGMPAMSDTSGTGPKLSQSPSTDADPREQLTKQLAVSDLEYLSNREAARLVGLALEQFDGNTVRPPGATRVETDIVWHRQSMTVALRVVPVPSGDVGVSHVDALLEGTIVPPDTRSPSELVIVTNRAYTEEAIEYAAEHDIRCFDAGHVEEWFRRARIPMDAVGTVLEDGENHDGPLTDLVEFPLIPDPRKTVDPLEINRAFDIDSLTMSDEEDIETSDHDRPDENQGQQETELDRSTARDDPLGGTQSPSGEAGTLYADPDEDGDFEAFDRFVDGIKDETQQSNASTDEDASTAHEASSSTDEMLTTYDDVDRKDLVFDLLEAKEDADEVVSWKDVRRHGSYPVEYYQKEFSSLWNALDAVDNEYTEDTQ